MSLIYYGVSKRRFESKIDPERDFASEAEARAHDIERATDIVHSVLRGAELRSFLSKPTPLFRAALEFLNDAVGCIPEPFEDLPF
jgi:hypothetical protein